MASLYLDGSPGTGKNGQRFLVNIGRQEWWFTQKDFTYLVKLAVARIRRGDGWIHLSELEASMNGHRYVYRLKQSLIGTGFTVENLPRQKKYRITAKPEAIGFDLDQLREFPDITVRRLF